MNAPAEVYALGLVALMGQKGAHHFVVDLDAMDPEQGRGLSLNIEIEGRKVTFTTGKCECPACLAKVGRS